MRRVLPAGRIDRLDVTHPVFNTFFAIKSLDVPYPGTAGPRALMGEFFGIYEDNDPAKRLMVVINYNMDLGDYVEWSGIRQPLLARADQRSLQVPDQLRPLRSQPLTPTRRRCG